MNRRRPSIGPFLLAVLAAVAAAAAPQLELAPNELDFGTVREGAVPERVLTLRNTGDAPLVIEKMQSSCACIVLPGLDDDTRHLAPGAERAYQIQYKTAGYSGARKAMVAITSNDPAGPRVLDVQIEIEMALRITPRAVHWARASRGETNPERVTVTATDPDQTVHLESIRSLHPHLQASAEMTTVDRQRAVAVAFALAEDAPLGPIAASAELIVRVGPQLVRTEIPVTVNVMGDMLVHPPAIVSVNRPLMPGTRVSQVTVTPTGGDPVRVLDILVTGSLRAEAPATEITDALIIPIYIAADAPAGPQAGQIHILTTSRDLPLVTIPVYFEALAPIRAEPRVVVLSPATPSAIIRLSAPAHPMEIRSVTASLDGVEARILTGTQRDGNPAAVEVAYDPAQFPGAQRGVVILGTNVPGALEMPIPVIMRGAEK
jgi:hypothetical protein